MTTPRTTIITVAYNSTGILPGMLASVPQGVPVVIVDNASSDGAALAVLAGGHGARLVINAENRGFGVACSIGAAAADTEFLLFLNPDAELDPDCIARLEAAFDRFPKAVAMNPRILESDGRPYFKRRSVLLSRRDWMARGWPESDREVSVLSGAALMVRKADFDAVGGFDPNIFLYHEDDDLSLRLRAQRGPVMFIHDAAVRHAGGQSTVRSADSAAFKAWHMGRSRVYAARKHGRPLPFLSSLLSAVGQAALPWSLLSRRGRAKRIAFLKGVLSGWRGGAAGQ